MIKIIVVIALVAICYFVLYSILKTGSDADDLWDELTLKEEFFDSKMVKNEDEMLVSCDYENVTLEECLEKYESEGVEVLLGNGTVSGFTV